MCHITFRPDSIPHYANIPKDAGFSPTLKCATSTTASSKLHLITCKSWIVFCVVMIYRDYALYCLYGAPLSVVPSLLIDIININNVYLWPLITSCMSTDCDDFYQRASFKDLKTPSVLWPLAFILWGTSLPRWEPLLCLLLLLLPLLLFSLAPSSHMCNLSNVTSPLLFKTLYSLRAAMYWLVVSVPLSTYCSFNPNYKPFVWSEKQMNTHF